jgi:hypothetical protein
LRIGDCELQNSFTDKYTDLRFTMYDLRFGAASWGSLDKLRMEVVSKS